MRDSIRRQLLIAYRLVPDSDFFTKPARPAFGFGDYQDNSAPAVFWRSSAHTAPHGIELASSLGMLDLCGGDRSDAKAAAAVRPCLPEAQIDQEQALFSFRFVFANDGVTPNNSYRFSGGAEVRCGRSANRSYSRNQCRLSRASTCLNANQLCALSKLDSPSANGAMAE